MAKEDNQNFDLKRVK